MNNSNFTGNNTLKRGICVTALSAPLWPPSLAFFSEPEFNKKWEAIGTPVVGGTASQFEDLIRKETVRLGQVVKNAGVTLD